MSTLPGPIRRWRRRRVICACPFAGPYVCSSRASRQLSSPYPCEVCMHDAKMHTPVVTHVFAVRSCTTPSRNTTAARRRMHTDASASVSAAGTRLSYTVRTRHGLFPLTTAGEAASFWVKRVFLSPTQPGHDSSWQTGQMHESAEPVLDQPQGPKLSSYG